MSKWEAFGSNVFEDGDYAFPCESPEQAARIVKLLNEGEALSWQEFDEAEEKLRRAVQPEGAAIAAAPASKETAK